MYTARSKAIPKKLVKRSIVDMPREKKKWNHIKCLNETRESRKKRGEGEKTKETKNRSTNRK